MKDVVHDGMHYFLHADKGVIRLVASLIKQPGVVAREYIAGHRKKYFQPLNFFLIVAGLFLFTTTFFHRFEQIEKASDIGAQVSHMPVKKQEVARIVAERKTKAVWFLTHYANLVAMFAAPFISLIVRAMYGKSKYNYTEHLIANLYLIGMTNLFYALIITPLAFIVNVSSANLVFTVSFTLVEIIYRSFFYHQFINAPRSQGVIKTTLKSIIAVISWRVFIFVAMGIYIMLGFL